MLVPLAVEKYLESLSATRRPSTLNRAAQILKGFQATYSDRALADLRPADIAEYIRSLPHSNRTKFNHQIRLSAMLRYHGITIKADKPRYVVPMPTV